MDEATRQMLDKYAEKLGTTTEHLWQVLVAQARVDFVVTTVQFGILAAGTYGIYRYWRWISSKKECHEGWVLLAGILTIILGVLDITAFCILGTYAASLLNPEYWALHQILTLIKQK